MRQIAAVVVAGLLVGLLAFPALVAAGPSSFDATAFHLSPTVNPSSLVLADNKGAVWSPSGSKVGTDATGNIGITPLAAKNASFVLSGAGALTVTSGQKLCLDGTTCETYAKASGGAFFVNAVSVNSASVLSGPVYAQDQILNNTATNGGSVAFNDPLRNLSTTTALFESSTAVTAGVDTAFASDQLASLAAGDKLWSYRNASVERASVLAEGTFYSNASSGVPGVVVQNGASVCADSACSTQIRRTANDLLLQAAATGGFSFVVATIPKASIGTDGSYVAAGGYVSAGYGFVADGGTPASGLMRTTYLRVTGAASVLPACAAADRGDIRLVRGGAGVADTFSVCTKDAADNYAWRALY